MKRRMKCSLQHLAQHAALCPGMLMLSDANARGFNQTENRLKLHELHAPGGHTGCCRCASARTDESF